MILGYANEVGEAFRSLTSVWFVRSTYGVASAYVVADTYDKSSKMNKASMTCVLIVSKHTKKISR